MAKIRAIDVQVQPRVAELAKAYSDNGPFCKYDRLYKLSNRLIPIGIEELVAEMTKSGIEKGVIFGVDHETTCGYKIDNTLIGAFVREFPDTLIGFAGCDPYKGTKALKDLENAVNNLGLRGIGITSFLDRLHPNDKKYFPIYKLAQELQIPVNIHSSVNFDSTSVMELAHPKYIDEVAVRFPDLRIIIRHAGWPWVLEAIAVAWRHENVYLDTSAISPKYLHNDLLRYMDSVLQDKVLFGTSYPLIAFDKAIDDFMSLPIKETTKEKVLYLNAKRLLN